MNVPEMRLAALEAAQAAGELVLKMRNDFHVVERRGIDLTTTADLASESTIRKILHEAWPAIPFYGEEDGGEIPGKGPVWVVDPIDGTDNYAGRRGPFGISIALVENRTSVMGTVAFPLTGEIYQGYAGFLSGFSTGTPMRASEEGRLERSTVWTDWSKNLNGKTIAILERLVAANCRYPSIRMCATHGLMMVATGAIEGYVCPKLAPEDHAAAGLLVELAGGRMSDMQGNPWSPLSESIVATNGRIHEELLDAISDIA